MQSIDQAQDYPKQVARHVVFGPLPKTSTGKIQKFRLREIAGG